MYSNIIGAIILRSVLRTQNLHSETVNNLDDGKNRGIPKGSVVEMCNKDLGDPHLS